MATASERQPLLRPPGLPSLTLRHAAATVVLLATITVFTVLSFSNPSPPSLLDRSVSGAVAPPQPPLATTRGSLYDRDLAQLNAQSHAAMASASAMASGDASKKAKAGKAKKSKSASASASASAAHAKVARARLMGSQKPQPLLFPVVAKPSPYSAPYNLYMLWSRVMQDMSPDATGDIFRRALRLGHVEGGEYRDAKFLPELAGRQFDDLAATCCSVVAVPPLSGGFIVYGTTSRRAEMIRAFLANGNAIVIAGGVVAMEFINRMFYSQLEPVDGNYDEGPFRKSPSAFGPWKKLPFASLGQIGTDVYAVKPSSLPEGSTVLFTSPDGVGVFIMPFCQRLNPEYGNPQPIIIPSSRCTSLKASGRGKCSCGTVTYIGYDFHSNEITSSLDHTKWIAVLRASATYYQGYNRY